MSRSQARRDRASPRTHAPEQRIGAGVAENGDGAEVKLELAPVRRGMPKVGRNEPCPCGSGKKYKNCCGRMA